MSTYDGFELKLSYEIENRNSDTELRTDLNYDRLVFQVRKHTGISPDTKKLTLGIKDTEIVVKTDRVYNSTQNAETETTLDTASLSPEQHKLLETVQRTMGNYSTDKKFSYELTASDPAPRLFRIHGLASISIHRDTGNKQDIARVVFDDCPYHPVFAQVENTITRGPNPWLSVWLAQEKAPVRAPEPTKVRESVGRS